MNKILNIIFPPICYKCKDIVEHSGLCQKCWAQIIFASNPACNLCSYPFSFETNNDTLCGNCIQSRPYFDRAFFVMKYDQNSKILIHQYKYSDRTYLTKYFIELLIPKLNEVLPEIDLIVPVPMYKYRLLLRRYNQAALLSREFASNTNIPSLQRCLVKTKNTKPQTALSRDTRLKNARGNYSINEEYKEKIIGKTILLVDDVFTTGATINECSRILKENGCKRIFAASIARTIL